jgi:phage-related protein
MSGALKAGGVYVAVSAAIGDFAKSMGEVVRTVEQTAKRVKESAKAIADVGTLFAAGMAGAVLAAAKSNDLIRRDLEDLQEQLYTLAAEVGDAFGPFVRDLSKAVASLVGAFQRMSPEVKEAGARFVVFMAATGATAGILSKSAGLVEGLAKAAGAVLVPALNAASAATKLLGQASATSFPAVGKAVAGMEAGVLKSLARVAVGFGAVLVPVAAVAAAIAALALLAGALYEAWSDSSTGMRKAVLEAWESLKGLGRQLADTLGGWWESLKGFLVAGLKVLLEAVAGAARKLGQVLGPLAKGLGLESLAGTFEELQSLTGERLLKDLQEGASFLADKASQAAGALVEGVKAVGTEVAEGVGYGLANATKGLKRIYEDTGLSKLPGQLKAALGGMLGGPAGQVRAPDEGVDVATVGGYGVGAGMTDTLRALAQGQITEIGRLGTKIISDRLRAAREEARRMADEVYWGIANVRKALTDKFLSRLESSLMGLVEAAQAGFAAGGPQGAVAAVGLDLLTQSKAFQELMSIVAAIVQQVADALGAFLVPMQEWYAALFLVVEAVMQALVPVLQQLGQAMASLAPIVVLVAELVAALAPVITLLMQVLNPLMVAFELLGGPALKALFDVVKFVARIIITIVKAIGDVWNGILGAIADVFRSLSRISVLGAKPLGFLGGWAEGLESAMVDTDALAESLRRLNGLTYEAAQERARETAAVLRNKEALQKATEELSNVPNAFKVALARFEAQDAQQGPATMPPVPVPTSPAAPAGNGATWTPSSGNTRPPPGGVGAFPEGTQAQRSLVINTLNVAAFSPTEAMQRFEGMLDRLNFRSTGSRGVGGRYALPEAP